MNLARLIRSAYPLSLNQLHRQRLDYIKGYEFPAGLRTKFAASHGNLDAVQQEMVFKALRDYFIICHQAKCAMVSMPSQVVDDAWHEFILFTKDYCEFCNHAFGRYLHHTPAEAMATKVVAQDGIRRAWKLACENESIHPGAPGLLPRIFAIDALLAIPNGFHYTLNCMSGRHAERNEYCATHIGCGGAPGVGAMGGCGGSTGSGDGGCGHGAGGDCGDGGGSSCGGHGCGGSGCGGGCGGS